jgi:acyl-CoA thioesterase-1
MRHSGKRDGAENEARFHLRECRMLAMQNARHRGLTMVVLLVMALNTHAVRSAQEKLPDPQFTASQIQRLLLDWPNFARFREANAALAPPAPAENRVVFMGDSITEGWGREGGFFPGKPYVNRGISGQTTPQMLVRFRADVVALKPKVVVILAGTNDIAGNTGPATPAMIEDNLASMAEIASANRIRVVLASILPAFDYPWRPGLQPVPKILAVNAWLKEYASAKGHVYLDYFSAMADQKQGLRLEYGRDGVHPNKAGYDVMAPLAEKAIADALHR